MGSNCVLDDMRSFVMGTGDVAAVKQSCCYRTVTEVKIRRVFVISPIGSKPRTCRT